MKKPATDFLRAGVSEFSIMAFCQCFARRVKAKFAQWAESSSADASLSVIPNSAGGFPKRLCSSG
jgi:hypothetical protein